MLRRSREASERFAERRRQEDDAERLTSAVPTLRSLRIGVEEGREGAIASESRHVRHIVVARAPALFLFPCGDASCSGGGHDLTFSILAHLKLGETTFVVDDPCHGNVGTASCSRVLRAVATAEYEKRGNP